MMYALDTNIIVDYVNSETHIMAQFRNAVSKRHIMVIPVAVDYEVTRGFHHTSSKQKEAAYTLMRRYCPVVEVNLAVWAYAASLWART